MNAKTRGKMWQNSPPPQESASPPARSMASHKGSADRTKSSAVAASTSSTAHTAATISRRESAGRSASESRSMVERYAFLPHPPSSAPASAQLAGGAGWLPPDAGAHDDDSHGKGVPPPGRRSAAQRQAANRPAGTGHASSETAAMSGTVTYAPA